jgi:hypothetical protein
MADADTTSIQAFVDGLIDQKGFTDLTPEVREELKSDIYQRLNDFIVARMIAAFSDEDVLKYEQLLKENKPQEELQQFAADHIPNFVDFLTNVLLEFQDVYLGRIQQPVIIPDDDGKNDTSEKSE